MELDCELLVSVFDLANLEIKISARWQEEVVKNQNLN